MPYVVLVPSHDIGGPLRVVANAPLTGPRNVTPIGLSCRREPARFSKRATADRIARRVPRLAGRALVMREVDGRLVEAGLDQDDDIPF